VNPHQLFFDRSDDLKAGSSIKPLNDTHPFGFNVYIDHELDPSIFNDRFKNDDAGAPAYDPKILLKITGPIKCKLQPGFSTDSFEKK
jgi:hypothetical protein